MTDREIAEKVLADYWNKHVRIAPADVVFRAGRLEEAKRNVELFLRGLSPQFLAEYEQRIRELEGESDE